MGQGMQLVSRSWKRQENRLDYPLDLIGVQLGQHLHFSPMKPPLDFRPPEGNLLLLDNTCV